MAISPVNVAASSVACVSVIIFTVVAVGCASVDAVGYSVGVLYFETFVVTPLKVQQHQLIL